MPLTPKQKSYLRSLAHALKPLVTVGATGPSEAVLKETDATLAHHELIKIRVNAEDRAARHAIVEKVCDHSEAALIQTIGHIAVLYRPAKKPCIKLP